MKRLDLVLVRNNLDAGHLCKCFFRMSQNVVLRIINLRSSVGILWNPILTRIYKVWSEKIDYSKFFSRFLDMT